MTSLGVLPVSYSAATALSFLGLLAGLGIGHLLGDTVLQSDRLATTKAFPRDDQLAAGVPWYRGWTSLGQHIASYLAAQAIALLIVAAVVPLTWPAVLAALIFSGATHAYIDRRWLVARIIVRKGCTGWQHAAVWIDQALHAGCLLLAAAIGARASTLTDVTVLAVLGLLLIADACRVEHRHARRVTSRPGPTDRL